MLSARWFISLLISFAAITAPQAVSAHSAFGNMGSFNNGFLHPLTAIEHILLLCALGIAFILHSKTSSKGIVSVLCGFVFGVIVRVLVVVIPMITPAITLCAFLMALYGILWRTFGTRSFVIASFISGLLIGLDSDAPLSGIREFSLFLGGAILAISAVEAYFLCCAPYIRKEWHHITLRIISAWIATIALMYFALLISKS
jgi:urease accessory protein